MSESRDLRLVWDLPVRICHWLLVLAVAGSWLTHELGVQAFAWHSWCGYTTLVLVFFRIVWGFVGPRHARFASFVRGPAATLKYTGSLFGLHAAQRHAGHNPLGALMVLLFLALLGVLGVTGLFANDEIMNTGPLYGYVSDATSDALSDWHRELMDYLWIAIGLHVAAVLLYWIVKRQNLIGPMFSGRKPGELLQPGDEIAGSRVWLALIIAGSGAALLYAIVATAPEPSLLLF